MSDKNLKAIAFYLPQFHPIPENDEWWGKGFTEWTNVKKAMPLFQGHEQPVEPGELGYYDLRNPEVRKQQAELARDHGITGFCYWHYWFGNGQKLLDMPFREVLKTGEPDFPFCLGWANESWTGIWHGSPDRILMKQEYPGKQDIVDHFFDILPAFSDSRYISVDGKPFFLVYKPKSHPNIKEFTNTFNELAIQNSLEGIHFVATNVPLNWNADEYGFSAIVPSFHNRILWAKHQNLFNRLKNLFSIFEDKNPIADNKRVYTYKEAKKYFLPSKEQMQKNIVYPTVVPNWDNSPRSDENSVIFTGSTPDLFEEHLKSAINLIQNNSDNHKILMIKSWNEWAEGNYLEPDKKWGRAYLEVAKNVFEEANIYE